MIELESFSGYIVFHDGACLAVASGRVVTLKGIPGAAWRPLPAGFYDMDMTLISPMTEADAAALPNKDIEAK